MDRRRWRNLLGLFLGGALGGWLIYQTATAPLVEGQPDPNNIRIHHFFLPGTSTTGWEVHSSATEMGARLATGDIVAAGGYKVAIHFAHGGRLTVSQDAVSTPVAGTIGATAPSPVGVLYHRAPYAGSIMAIGLSSSDAITANAAHAEATVFTPGGALQGMGLRAVIGAGLTATQYGVTTQAKDSSLFTAAQAVGCRITTDAAIAPTTAELLCTLVIEY